jgi:ketosteroid isomerase-like protein
MSKTPEQVVREYFDFWNAGDFKGLTGLFADDMVWVIKGFSPQSGEFTRDQISSVLLKLPELDTAEPFLLHLKTITANNERAAVEFTSTMKFRDGREYRNEYHFLIFVKDGKIIRGHEYLCTWTAVHNGIGDDIAKVMQAA